MYGEAKSYQYRLPLLWGLSFLDLPHIRILRTPIYYTNFILPVMQYSFCSVIVQTLHSRHSTEIVESIKWQHQSLFPKL